MPTILTKPPILIEVLVPGTRNEPGNEPPPACAGCAPASGEPASSATAAVRLPSAVSALILRVFVIITPTGEFNVWEGKPPSCAVNSAGSPRNDKSPRANGGRIDDVCVREATVSRRHPGDRNLSVTLWRRSRISGPVRGR